MKLLSSKIIRKGIGKATFVNDAAEAINTGTEINLDFSIPEFKKNNVLKPKCSKGEIKALDIKNQFQLVVNEAIVPNQEFDIDFTVAITVKPESIVDIKFKVVEISIEKETILTKNIEEANMWWYSRK